MEELILASASPRRREILTLAGVPFSVCPAEDGDVPAGLTNEQRVQVLARGKAAAVAGRFPGRLILGADTMVELDGQMLGKPRTADEAVEMLLRLQGRAHRVLTGVWLIRADERGGIAREDGFTDAAAVRFFPMSEEEARAYVATGEPMDKAGAYGIQGYGMRFVEGICGDFYTVMGLPGSKTLRFLHDFAK